MKYTRYEFCTIGTEHLSNKIINDINLNRVTKGLGAKEAELSLLTQHGNERLNYAGSRGWELVSVQIVSPTDVGSCTRYYMQRSSDHEMFGGNFNDEYLDSILYQEHQKQIERAAGQNS